MIETLTGLDIPAPGRISTVPSMRGYRMSAWQAMRKSWESDAHQSSRYARITNEEICVRAARHSHKSGHLLAELAPTRGP